MLFAIARADGGVSIMKMVVGTDPQVEIAKWNPVDRDAVVSVSAITEADVPKDRTFRNSWRLRGGKIEQNTTRALEIAQENIRAERTAKLAELDLAYMRADEAGDAAEKKRIAGQKQRLRDATADPRLVQASDVDGLKVAMQTVISEL